MVAGQRKISFETATLYSDHEELTATYTKEVDLMLSKELQVAPIGMKSDRSRIIKASLKTK